jgi:hypothetical protein
MTAPERFADSQIPLAPRAPSIHDPSQPAWALIMVCLHAASQDFGPRARDFGTPLIRPGMAIGSGFGLWAIIGGLWFRRKVDRRGHGNGHPLPHRPPSLFKGSQ